MGQHSKLARVCEFKPSALKRSDVRQCPEIESLLTSAGMDERALAVVRDRLTHLQTRLWRAQTHSVLIVIQGVDASGKDGVIRHVFSGLNPSGFSVSAFKKPTAAEHATHYLARYLTHLPVKGCMAAFNRSYYEDVLVPTVHPESLGLQGRALKRCIDRRLEEMVALESAWVAEGVEVLKFYLSVSYREQGQRLLARLEDPHKRYKFSEDDVVERRFFKDYQNAAATILSRTHHAAAPWYVIPADDKPSARVLLGTIVAQRLAAITQTGEIKSAALNAQERAWRDELKRSLR
jgi:PPK2 family polyphosphate:nucleotide phosphotransferase